jgi:hypothetical protein
MSITTRSKRQPEWLPVLIAVATGTGGTATWWVTVSGPVRQFPGQLAGVADVLGVAGADVVWLEVGRGEPVWLCPPGPVDVVVAHETAPAMATTVPVTSAMSLRGIGAPMWYLQVRAPSA